MSMIRSKLNHNKYLYQIYLSGKGKRNIEKVRAYALESCRVFPKHILHMRDYIEPIEKNGNIVSLKSGGKMYVPYFKTDAIQNVIVNSDDYYEIDTLVDLKDYIPEKAVIMDIGANIGNHTVFFSNVCKAKKVYSFEPIQDTFAILEKNISINGLEGTVAAYNVAVGSKRGNAAVKSFDEKNIGGTALVENSGGEISVVALDDIGFEEKIDFIKMDVEGFERQALKGGEKLFDADRPSVFVEIQKENYPWVTAFFERHGYYLKKAFPCDNYLFLPFA